MFEWGDMSAHWLWFQYASTQIQLRILNFCKADIILSQCNLFLTSWYSWKIALSWCKTTINDSLHWTKYRYWFKLVFISFFSSPGRKTFKFIWSLWCLSSVRLTLPRLQIIHPLTPLTGPFNLKWLGCSLSCPLFLMFLTVLPSFQNKCYMI